MTVKKTDELELGAEVKEPILNRDGSLLLNKGAIVNYELVSRLKKHDIDFIDKIEVVTSEIEVADMVQGLTIDEEKMQTSINVVKEVFASALSDSEGNIRNAIPEQHLTLVKEVIDDIMTIITTSEDLLYRIKDLFDADDYTYRHSVNVCVLSIMTAKALNYNEDEIRNIALGSLLHDIGKAHVKYGLVQKPTPLTEEEKEEMKMHATYGYELVKDMPTLPYSVKQIIRLHHEKCDGSGYPLKLKGMEIPQYVRIVTVCDMYDAMTANRIYRKPMPIHVALEVLMRDCVYKLDRKVYRAMSSTICIFAIGEGVMLSDGRVGIVSGYRHQCPSRPKVKIFDFSTKTGDFDVVEINLEEENTLFIIDTWDVDSFKAFFNRTPSKELFDPKEVDVGTMIG